MIFGPQISPFLPTRASHNDTNQSKYALTGWNQTYLPITTHFGTNRLVFGKLLSDFWSTSPKIEDFLAPRFRPFYLLELRKMIETSQNMLLLGGIKLMYP